MLGFPKDDDTIGGLFGVNEEDRHAWAKERQMRLERQQMQKPGLAKKATMAAYEIAAARHYFADACSVHRKRLVARWRKRRPRRLGVSLETSILNSKRFDGSRRLVATNSVADVSLR